MHQASQDKPSCSHCFALEELSLLTTGLGSLNIEGKETFGFSHWTFLQPFLVVKRQGAKGRERLMVSFGDGKSVALQSLALGQHQQCPGGRGAHPVA